MFTSADRLSWLVICKYPLHENMMSSTKVEARNIHHNYDQATTEVLCIENSVKFECMAFEICE